MKNKVIIAVNHVDSEVIYRKRVERLGLKQEKLLQVGVFCWFLEYFELVGKKLSEAWLVYDIVRVSRGDMFFVHGIFEKLPKLCDFEEVL